MTDGHATFTVMTKLNSQPVSGYDSMILPAPAQVWQEFNGKQMIETRRLSQLLKIISFQAAARMQEWLHHAEWVITKDPAVVETKGMIHDCLTCRAGTDQALAALREFPDRHLLVGTLYWADMSEPSA